MFIRLADAPPLTVAFYRMLFAAVAIGAIVAFRNGRDLEGIDRIAFRRSVLAGLLLAVHFATWIASLDYTSVANSVIIVIGSKGAMTLMERILTNATALFNQEISFKNYVSDFLLKMKK